MSGSNPRTTGNGPYGQAAAEEQRDQRRARDPGGKTVVTKASRRVAAGSRRAAADGPHDLRGLPSTPSEGLRFFAHDDGISRVRHISKMLGISGVEAAQQFLRADRNELRSEARVIEARLAEADLESLQGELEEAKSEVRAPRRRAGRSREARIRGGGRGAEERPRGRSSSTPPTASTRLSSELRETEARRQRAEDRAAEAEKVLKSGEGRRGSSGAWGRSSRGCRSWRPSSRAGGEPAGRAERRDLARREAAAGAGQGCGHRVRGAEHAAGPLDGGDGPLPELGRQRFRPGRTG